MKSAMPFLGLTRAHVRRIAHELGADHRLDLADIERYSRELWDQAEHREERYAAIDLTGLRPALGRPELVDLHEHQALTGAWWDYVDQLAHRIAALHDADRAAAALASRRWLAADSFWLRRLAILGQLGRKDRTDRELLTEAIEANAADKEFFIRKAIGWALRDFARTDPAWVRAFADAHDLSPLARREALKHL
jgi:3-methyladenine DNA glycosylase AlkD